MCSESPENPHDFTSFRHRWEMPLIWLSAIITFGALAAAITLLALDDGTTLDDTVGAEAARTLRDWSSGLLLLLIAPIVVYVYRLYLIATEKAGAIRAGRSNSHSFGICIRILAARWT